MLDFLRLLTPRHADALQPVSPLRRLAGMSIDAVADADAATMGLPTAHDGVPEERRSDHGPDDALLRPSSTRPRRNVVETEPEASGYMPMQDVGTDRTPMPASVHRKADGMDTQPNRISRAIGQVDDTRQHTPLSRHDVMNRDATTPTALHSHLPRPPSVETPVAVLRAARSPGLRPAIDTPISPATVAMYAPERAAPPPPPEIHVSIDRIEVRAPAVPKAAPQRPRPRQAPEPQSLHDYLRGKSAP